MKKTIFEIVKDILTGNNVSFPIRFVKMNEHKFAFLTANAEYLVLDLFPASAKNATQITADIASMGEQTDVAELYKKYLNTPAGSIEEAIILAMEISFFHELINTSLNKPMPSAEPQQPDPVSEQGYRKPPFDKGWEKVEPFLRESAITYAKNSVSYFSELRAKKIYTPQDLSEASKTFYSF